MKHTSTRKLVESAVMIALATVLSLLKLAELPYGGSVTLASMLPIAIIAYRNGTGWGLATGLAYAIVQQLTGLKTLSYVTGPASVVAVILLDYGIAFTVIGLAGVYRKRIENQAAALTLGTVTVSCLRYLCHVVSGATVWKGLSIPTAAALGYSCIYNATYMLPETIVTALAAFYIASLIDFRSERLRRVWRERMGLGGALVLAATLLLFAAGVYDIVALFAHMQDPETGVFQITRVVTSGIWRPALIVTLSAALSAAALIPLGLCLLRRKKALDKNA